MEMNDLPSIFYEGGADFRRLLKDVEDRYGDAFADHAPEPFKTSSISLTALMAS